MRRAFMRLSPRTLSLAGWMACSACLAGGYLVSGQPPLGMMLPLTLLPLLAGTYDRRRPALGLSWLAMVGGVGLAAGGALLSAPAVWMTLAAAAGLGAWDLALWEADAPLPHSGGGKTIHLRALAQALGVGVLVAVVGTQVSLPVPFFAMLLGVFLLVASLDRVWRYLSR